MTDHGFTASGLPWLVYLLAAWAIGMLAAEIVWHWWKRRAQSRELVYIGIAKEQAFEIDLAELEAAGWITPTWRGTARCPRCGMWCVQPQNVYDCGCCCAFVKVKLYRRLLVVIELLGYARNGVYTREELARLRRAIWWHRDP